MADNKDHPQFKQANHIHFTGIKGVGMTAAALCAQDLGKEISGSDVEEDFVTADVLKQRNIQPSIGFKAEHIPEGTDLIVYTGAHQGINNPEVKAGGEERGIRTISHAKAVGELMYDKLGVSICGVGGKTSTSAMLANILDYANRQPSFLIGVGKVLNLQVPGKYTSGEHFIAEADEYMVSPGTDNTPRFLFQDPKMIITTNVAHDHPDQYDSLEDTKKAFLDFFKKLPEDGVLIANGNSAPIHEILENVSLPRVILYGKSPKNDWWVKDSFNGQGKQLVTFATKDQEFNLTLSVPGVFNAMNALAAYIAALELGIDHQTAVEALQLFRGSKRRFEKIAEQDGILYYDDYAHHPSQIMATLTAAKQWLPLNQIVALFQPHTYTRTKALLVQFSKSFSHADQVIITDIYASAREEKDPSVSGYVLAEKIKQHRQNVQYVPLEDLPGFLKEHLKPQDALFTLGAGDIYMIHDKILS